MRLFTSPRITALLQRFRPPEGEPISAKVLNKSIETAQKRVEQRNYTIRKHTLEYDDVMNKQRAEIYAFRNEVLHVEDTFALAREVMESVTLQMADKFFVSRSAEGSWNPKGFSEWLVHHFPVTFDSNLIESDYITREDIQIKARDIVLQAFTDKLALEESSLIQFQALLEGKMERPMDPQAILREVIRNILIRNIDREWQGHLLQIDHLRTEVSMRAVGQKDPLLEFKQEAFSLFDRFTTRLKTAICHSLFKFEMMAPRFTQRPPEDEIQPELKATITT